MAMTTRVPWGTLEATGDQSEYVTTTCTTVRASVPLALWITQSPLTDALCS